MIRYRLGVVLCLVVSGAAAAAACGSTEDGSVFKPGQDSGGLGDSSFGVDGSEDDSGGFGPGPGSDGDISAQKLTIEPADKVITINSGQPIVPVQYTAKINGQTVGATFRIDRGELANVNPTSGALTAGGTYGGKAKVYASYQGKEIWTNVTIVVRVLQSGAPATPADAGAGDSGGGGSGGFGGVGGSGPGGAVDSGGQALLLGASTPDPGLKFLYPYDNTVFPRGILPPLLQWQPGAQSYDSVYIHIKETAFEYQGFFTKPATPFVNHPIPKAIWQQLTRSNDGEPVSVTLTFTANGQTYGPITQTWKIAQGVLKGTVYYDSYGTRLAKNYGGAKPNNGRFGGATLAIRGDSTDPVLIAGGDGNDAQCRVCHSVAANGSRLVTTHGDNGYNTAAVYDLLNNNAETVLNPQNGLFSWSGIYPDGTMLMNSSGGLTSAGGNGLYTLPTSAPVTSTGLPAGLRATAPAFSPDGKHVSFLFYAGNTGGDAGVTTGDKKSLAVMDFDNTSKTFSNFRVLYTPTTGVRAIFPSFLPTNDAIIFQVQTRENARATPEFAGTRSDCECTVDENVNGGRAELWWVDLATRTPKKLNALNGLDAAGALYMPTATKGHGDDSTVNYLPTVNPVTSGGYAWVVFMSRRLYGNVATINPFWSDPRFYDLTVNPTPKKLWVAAIDLNAAPGTDPSHPAFYLPAQELLAGNSRGFWVVDPCKQNGNGCETGDECCGGYCRPGGDAGALVCTETIPACAQEFEKCTTVADCCGGLKCIGGRCGIDVPPPPR